MVWKPEDARNLRRQDQARGKRKPLDPDVEQEEKTRKKLVSLLLRIPDEITFRRELETVIADYGLQIEPDDLAQMVQIWRKHHLG